MLFWILANLSCALPQAGKSWEQLLKMHWCTSNPVRGWQVWDKKLLALAQPQDPYVGLGSGRSHQGEGKKMGWKSENWLQRSDSHPPLGTQDFSALS